MSSLNSLLNFVVLIAICVTAFFFLQSPKDYGSPPEDPWFKSEVLNRAEPVLVKFGAQWCPPCRAMEPELDELARQADGQVSVVRVDVDERSDLARHYRVSSIPRLLLFHHGKVVADRVGYADHQELQNWISSHASLDHSSGTRLIAQDTALPHQRVRFSPPKGNAAKYVSHQANQKKI